MAKTPYVFPIVGGRKIEHLKANIEALDVVLSEAEIDEIDAATPFEHGWPLELMFEFQGAQKYNSRMTSKDVVLLKCASYLEEPEPPKVCFDYSTTGAFMSADELLSADRSAEDVKVEFLLFNTRVLSGGDVSLWHARGRHTLTINLM